MIHRAWLVVGTLHLLVLVAPLSAQPASYNPDDIGPGGPENCLGVRSCTWQSSTQVQIVFGSSANTSYATSTTSYRLMSETDPAYQNGKFATAASVSLVDDVTYPTGWSGKSYKRYTAQVTFPTPMQTGQSYFVQVLGASGTPTTGGRSAAWVVSPSSQTITANGTNCLGIRHLELITNKILKITTGDGVDVTKVDNLPGNFVLTCASDPNYGSTGRAAVQVGRRSRGDCFVTTAYPYNWFQKHEIYVIFDQPFVQGKTYGINLNSKAAITCGTATASIRINDLQNVNPIIAVNQLGYLPEAPAKYAYVGEWMGSAGVLTLDGLMPSFSVHDASTDNVVLTGTPTLRKRHAWYLQNGVQQTYQIANEGVYRQDYTYEDVWQLDLSSLTTPGQYYITIPGMGSSFIFNVGDSVYAPAFDSTMIGVTHQRCGLPMNAPWSAFYRPTCHRNFTTVGSTHNVDIQGGHHDAGDFDPRSHLDVAEYLLNAYYMAAEAGNKPPKTFFDGQNRLPEYANGIPDILDEARWELDLWTRMQDASGGVHYRIEAPSDVDEITPGELDTIADVEGSVTAAASFRVAGDWALIADFYAALGDTTDANNFTTKATNAFNYGVNNGGLSTSNRDAICYGAILMYRRTGTTQYRTYFETYSVFGSVNPVSGADLDSSSPSYDQELASFYYASCNRAVDSTLKGKILTAYATRMTTWINYGNTYGYRYLPNPYAPNDWGTGAYPTYIASTLHAYMLWGNQTYLQWAILECDFSLGCNPMNTIFITRLGQRCISCPCHNNSRYNPNGPIPGTQGEGPTPQTAGGTPSGTMDTWVAPALWPTGPWPQLLTYTDWYFTPGMDEPTVTHEAQTAMAYGFMLHPPAPLNGGGQVRACKIFYDNDGDIASDKTPLLPGGTATVANYTSFYHGINGIIVDVSGMPATPTLDDFSFTIGNDNNPNLWPAAPAPTGFTIIPGGGVSGSTRVEFTWPNNTIPTDKWLQITVRAGSRTGLSGGDVVYYFGNAIGETGNSSASARVDLTDLAAVRADPHKTFAKHATSTDMCDFNRDMLVTTVDEIICRSHLTSALTELKLITVP